jgi:hypothetical protein
MDRINRRLDALENTFLGQKVFGIKLEINLVLLVSKCHRQ